MPHDEQAAKSLAEYRIASAKGCLITAKRDLDNDDYKACANRCYYAIFHAMRAVLALDRQDYKRHSGVIAAFNRDYIKTGVFDSKFSLTIKSAFEVRSAADYDDFYVISKAEVQQQYDRACEFADAVESYLKQK